MNPFVAAFSSLTLTVVFSLSAVAQQRLESLATDFETRASADRAEAESLAIRQGLPIRAIRPDGSVIELKRLRNGIPVYYKTDNVISAKTISTDKVYPGGAAGFSLTGNGITLGEWDGGGVRLTHQEFGGRVLTSQGALNFHATHVAGTILAAGVQPSARGMSYQASLKAFDWSNDMAEMTTQAGLGLRASNHSYGLITGWDYGYVNPNRWTWFGDPAVSQTEDWAFGFYDQEAQDWDNVAWNAPYLLIVKSAGNDRSEGPTGSVLHDVWGGSGWVTSTTTRNKDGNGGYDCIAGGSVSKDPLVVAAVNDISGGYSGSSSVVMSSFSGWGPTDDGRIKPDISANGVGLYSALETSNNAYGTMSGTSMAAPSVTGSIGLLLQHQKNLHGDDSLLASTIKGIILHTADEAGPNPGPDYMFGWGLMNTLKAAQLMSLDSADGPGSHIREYQVFTNDTIEFDIASTGTEPLRATLCWHDVPVGLPPLMVDPPNPVLRNDLDMRIIRKSDGAVFYPWKCDPAAPSAAATRAGDNARDNVEQVLIDSPGRTLYTVRITHKTTIYNPPTLASLVMSGNAFSIGGTIAAAADTAAHTRIPGDVFADSMTIHNTGDSLLIGTITKDPDSFWLSLTEDSVNIPSLDSAVIHYSIDGSLWSQWTSYGGSLTFETNDAFTPSKAVPVLVTVLGPTYSGAPGSFIVDLDSAEIGYDTMMVRNPGAIPLNVTVSDSGGGPLPSWVTADPDTFSVPPGDSVAVVFTTNALNEALGDYVTTLRIAHDDSTQGPDYVPFFLNIGTRTIFSLDVGPSWNIVSLPVEPITGLKALLFPSAITAASGFNGSYYQAETLVTGAGYWMKFPAGATVPIDGYTFEADTIPVFEGWNMVGSLYEAVSVGAIIATPADALGSAFFQYDGGYAIADSIRPGKGYWVKAIEDADLYVSLLPAAAPKRPAAFTPADFSGITVSGDAGGSATLYFASGPAPAVKSALPPKPPAGAFDARFSDGTFVAAFSDGADAPQSRTVLVSGSGSGIRVSVRIAKDDRSEYVLRDAAGGSFPLRDGQELKFTADGDGETAFSLIAGNEPLPTEFALGQNYPNPFNPATTVSFSLPVEETIAIRLYNVLGNEVATIAAGKFSAGRHEVTFNAESLPSGVYVYTMRAGSFSSSRKMVLMR